MSHGAPKTPQEWIARVNAGPLNSEEQRALLRWLAEPGRMKELKSNPLLWQLESRSSSRAQDGSATVGVLAKFGRGRIAAGLAAAALAVAIFLAAPQSGHLRNHSETETAIGEISRYVLPDNSDLTIGADTFVEVDFSAGRRTLHLARGEVFLDVQRNPDVPFVIKMGAKEVVVTGTQLNVNFDKSANAFNVAVVEGHITVIHDETRQPQKMQAGDVMSFPASGPGMRRNLTPQQVVAWRTRQLYFDDAPLHEVLASVNRYTPKPVVVGNTDVESLRLTGQFTAGDVDTVLLSLSKLYGIEVRDMRDQWLLVSAAAR